MKFFLPPVWPKSRPVMPFPEYLVAPLEPFHGARAARRPIRHLNYGKSGSLPHDWSYEFWCDRGRDRMRLILWAPSKRGPEDKRPITKVIRGLALYRHENRWSFALLSRGWKIRGGGPSPYACHGDDEAYYMVIAP